jgi:hypothetical protein
MVYAVVVLYVLSRVGAGAVVRRWVTSAIHWVQLSRILHADENRIHSPKRRILNKKHDGG